jgi:thiol-disulfide isomerase/thioredoxin
MRLRLTVLVVAAAIALTGCSAAPKAPGKAGLPATLAFTGRTLDGKAFDAASLAGRPTVLWFWAPWCATCASEAQSISDLAPKYQDKVNFVGIAGMGGEKEMKEFVSDYQVGMITQVADNAGTVWRKFAVAEQSTYVLLNRKGDVVAKGWLDDLQITERVGKLATS